MSLLMKIAAFFYIRTYGKRGCREGWLVEREEKTPFGVSTKLHFVVFLIYILQKGKHVSTDV